LSFRFQADADLNPEIGRGLRRREPSIDFRAALGVIAEGTPDSEVLQIAADDDRVLVSRDVATMPGHFARFVAQHESPGVLLIPSRRAIGAVIEGLLVVWLTWTPEDLRNQARWLP
jgi:predicted nuclease of predicted toxin-antitoxin system